MIPIRWTHWRHAIMASAEDPWADLHYWDSIRVKHTKGDTYYLQIEDDHSFTHKTTDQRNCWKKPEPYISERLK